MGHPVDRNIFAPKQRTIVAEREKERERGRWRRPRVSRGIICAPDPEETSRETREDSKQNSGDNLISCSEMELRGRGNHVFHKRSWLLLKKQLRGSDSLSLCWTSKLSSQRAGLGAHNFLLVLC